MTHMRKSFSKTSDLARAYAKHQLTEGKAREGRAFVEGDTIYSYGHHFPIAHRIRDNEYLFNDDSYSRTTSKQQSAVRSALEEENAKIVETDTSGIKHGMEHKEEYE